MSRGTRDAVALLALLVVGAIVLGLRGGSGGAPEAASPPRATTTTPGTSDTPGTADGVATAGGALALPVPDDGRTWTGTVVHVSDGDTLIARVEDPRATTLRPGEELRVRLLRIDTPERERDDQPEECWAGQARAALEALLPDGELATFWFDVEPQDQYGRELAHVWAADGTWVNGALLAGGHAEVVTFRPNVAHEDRVRQLEAAALDARLGMWGSC